MKISGVKSILKQAETVSFRLENGDQVPEHFHITEIGIVDRHFIDCGGTVRREQMANFQLWNANDYEHRLKPAKLLNIITLSERVLEMPDLEVEVEYQSGTIGRYGLDFKEDTFVLMSKTTACLANDSCGIPVSQQNEPCCNTNGNCC